VKNRLKQKGLGGRAEVVEHLLDKSLSPSNTTTKVKGTGDIYNSNHKESIAITHKRLLKMSGKNANTSKKNWPGNSLDVTVRQSLPRG
jgi:hypothetical protein